MHRDLDSIPVLAREGAIVPTYPNGDSNDLSLDQPLDIHIWRGNGSFDLYEDDGETRDPRYALTHMEVREEGKSLQFHLYAASGHPEILPEKRSIRLIFRDIQYAELWVNGQAAEFSPDGILLEQEPNREMQITLRQVVCGTNPDPSRLRTELLTRVQGEVIWKNTVFRSEKHMPRFLLDALLEIKALEQSK
jgi:hypothetical protein